LCHPFSSGAKVFDVKRLSLKLVLATLLAAVCLTSNGFAQFAKPVVITTPALVDNVVQLRVGEQLAVTVLNTLASKEYRIQRTYPFDPSSLTITSSGGNLVFPAFPVATDGEQIITIFEGGEGTFCYSFIINVLPNPRAPGNPLITNILYPKCLPK
jgi:hypothetical protein